MPDATLSRENLRCWVEQRRAAAELERREARVRGYHPNPIAAGIELMALAQHLLGWPIPEDATRRRENEQKWESWARLRQALGRR